MSLKKRKWLKITALFFLATIIIIWIGSRPSVGKISKDSPQPSPKPTEPILYHGKIVSFWYPPNLEIRVNQNFDQTGIGKVELLGGRGDSSHWVISVSKVNTPNLSEISAVIYRQLYNKTYHQENINIGKLEGLYFKKEDRSEFIVFAIKNRQLFTIALTVNSNDPQYEQEFLDFIRKFNIIN